MVAMALRVNQQQQQQPLQQLEIDRPSLGPSPTAQQLRSGGVCLHLTMYNGEFIAEVSRKNNRARSI